MTKEFIQRRLFIIAMFIALTATTVFAQGTSFNFQGRLNDGTNPASGQYDLQFRLYSAISGGGQLGSTIARPATVLINGVFSVNLDFGGTAFNNPNAVFLEIGVKPAGSPNAYTILGPRQQLTVVPFAVRANTATNADNATNAQTAVNATNATNATNSTTATTATNALSLGGVSASGYAQLNIVNTGDLRTNGALAITGNAFQPVASYGFAKAMIEVSNTGTISRCYNGITNSSTNGCGFTITTPAGTLFGIYRINFGFAVSNVFVSATTRYENSNGNGNNNGGVNYRNFDNTTIEFFTYSPNLPQDTSSRYFTLILF